MKEKVEMSIKEAERLGIMRQIDKKVLTLVQASMELGLSLRQTKRVRKRYLNQGEKGLISQKRGKESNRKICAEKRDKVMDLIKTRYNDFGPTLINEKLKEVHKIELSSETIRNWMIQEGIWESKKKKKGRVYQRRKRRSRFGELIQGDGSPHDWFEGRGKKCTLLQFVDDATSKTTVARFEVTETTEGYLNLLKGHVESYGRPCAIYVDKHSIFRVNKEEIKKGVGITRFGKVVKELNIQLICAHSPQAKGRVERKNGVFQDRLIKEMRLLNISTIEEANTYLSEFLEKINKKFGKEPESKEDAHRPLRRKDNLKKILAEKTTRKLSKNLTLQYKGTLYQIETETPNRLKHATVEVIQKEGEKLEIEYQGKILKYQTWSEKTYERPEILDSKEIAMKAWLNKKVVKPRKKHPWR